MKRILYTLLLIAFAGLLYAGADIVEFSAQAQNNRIVVVWKTSHEENVSKFVVERSTDEKNFFPIGEVQAKGAGYKYEFVDSKLGKINGVSYYYRLKIVDRSGSYTYSEQVVWASPIISSMTRTWGSIKALFR